MTSQESVIARDSMGFEDIDEFWDTVGMFEIKAVPTISTFEDDETKIFVSRS